MGDYFVDRSVQYPGRVRITGTGSGSFAEAFMMNDELVLTSESDIVADLTRDEGTVLEEGTPLNATNLNGGILSMIGDKLKCFVISATHSQGIAIESGYEYIVVWSAQGASGSKGIDYVWLEGSSPVSRNIVLSGTNPSQLLTYTAYSDTAFLITNTASATTVHAMIVAQRATAI